jgi:hypothetical protein
VTVSVPIGAYQLLRQRKDNARKQVIGNGLFEIAEYFRDRGQTFEPQAIVHLKTETKILDITKRLSWFHGAKLLSKRGKLD